MSGSLSSASKLGSCPRDFAAFILTYTSGQVLRHPSASRNSLTTAERFKNTCIQKCLCMYVHILCVCMYENVHAFAICIGMCEGIYVSLYLSLALARSLSFICVRVCMFACMIMHVYLSVDRELRSSLQAPSPAKPLLSRHRRRPHGLRRACPWPRFQSLTGFRA